jgi:transcriptional regulator with XRE-family HTH domain
MADELGMKQPMYARYESGKTLPSAELLFQLCSKLQVSSDWLLGLK